ncbi:pilus assembly FimT family protein [Campylobacter gastrosuis]|uniref:Prepilin-type N-terminal cleavage/methylation domain-containing protein n=1 Tax=Campylobacter gastrosuis TaxID=2974576 RepID=A0ABT7HQT3_9BACT|nr:prepilin-type N-terminal cleavage/methylation domain-containing protein [Campylobacter gastrosuis]MDL0089264.1 prepilin-type N-terminal cleavage/methylation domain-containing protein [Campylobacter gastrosuis]
MKRAFSLVELVFVVVVITILATIAMPKQNRDPLREAADQIISHIRYTQHLAMQDSKFKVDCSGKSCVPVPDWFKDYWRLMIHYDTKGGVKIWRYTVYQDTSHSGNPNSTQQVAPDPADPTKILTSGFAKQAWTKNMNKRLNLTNTFGVSAINFSGCGGQTIAFDSLGRPYSALHNATRPYEKLLKQNCKITLTGSNGNQIGILIFAETGYACVINDLNAKTPECEKF